MKVYIALFLILLNFSLLNSQYTETINSNRPGLSQGAFSVGKDVLQFEALCLYLQKEHSCQAEMCGVPCYDDVVTLTVPIFLFYKCVTSGVTLSLNSKKV